MLKIKDNVELKELEKFGFVGNERNEYRPNSKITIGEDNVIYLVIYSSPSRIPMPMFDDNVIRAYIDDLEKADLVEKVLKKGK